MKKILVLGASGYVGTNMLAHISNADVVAVARQPIKNVKCHAIDLSTGLIPPNHPLFSEKPDIVLYLARPAIAEFSTYRTFHTNVQALLLKWAENPQLQAVHLASSTMVYRGDQPIATDEDKRQVFPLGIYEYFKLESELFLQFLGTAVRPDVDFNAWRLPLMFGGIYDPSRHMKQFVYEFYNRYRDGHSWKFNSERDCSYGFSWAYLPDAAKAILNYARHHSGYKVLNIASGFSTYWGLHQLFSSHLTIGSKPLKLYRSRFEIKDESGIPQMSMNQAFQLAFADQQLVSAAN